MYIGVNGKCIREEQAVVSVFDHGFLYGMGLFETFRTYEGIPFLFEQHLDRLADGCRQLGIAYEPDPNQLRSQITELLQLNQLADGYVRLSVSAGVAPLGMPQGDYTEPNVILYMKQLPSQSIVHEKVGRPLQLLNHRRNTPEGTIRLKSAHYMNNILARRELSTYPWATDAEGLQLDQHGYIAEGIVSNIFFAQGDRICTPSLDTGILPGITRAHMLTLAAQEGLVTEEGLFTVNELIDAYEIWITNSIQEIVPIHTVYDTSGQSIWYSRSDQVTNQLKDAYSQSIQLIIDFAK